MKYQLLKEFKDEEFRRLTGVKRSTFEKMTHIIKDAEIKKKAWELKYFIGLLKKV